ncbi:MULTISPECIES: PTS sugar transporter subunit IIA [Brevibacillus]|uniref:PTS sugar transporter subunit IIA n=1 Tax=Brevibacillus TaxID=55080 RepID=UPI000D0FB3DD|nr:MULTISPECIES: PTS sugar transporter subunit IIA [Brevibacillus]PSJ68596.1 PTS mannitol transporter subunit IIA [Brevibacillus brevis]RED34104.1 PTS system D-mannitol-specific IIA component (Fru family) [Brevibacillus brevis]TQK62828.1 PTS system D-mannitol-specific IIA component (Fru family) [Brevibacillus sp. AG162]VEF92326.1 Mannitol-specific phosphotransferase enzyme IIA component [Brevibacillus brevis]GEC92095.1 mannitol-specific phosphotransferase enzyme IIA component [Brevibacillus br
MKNILTAEKIMLNAKAANKEEAIRLAGQLLVRAGHVTEAYVEKMQEREQLATTYIGSGVAIPHGTNESKAEIQSTGISIIQVPEGVDFGEGNTAYLLVGIAAVGDEHLEVLSNIAILCSEEENVKRIVNAASAEEIIAMFSEEV